MGKLSRFFGNKSEDLAVDYLQSNGFDIIERNYYASRLGEIDIIAKKGSVIHFVEVKSSFKDFEPIYNITPTKLHRLIKSANYYLKAKKLDFAWCIDALIIKNGKVELIENITL
jgi:putative endonuclease